jgi:single-stranded-DNA-specific exonuclease
MSQDELIKLLLKNRGLEKKRDIDAFFNPPHPNDYSLTEVGLKPASVKKAIDLIGEHQKQNHPIAVYGDYDVDGLTATAILWETIYSEYKGVFPHIPHRREEGYGLSQKGIDHCLSQGAKLIITVDNGIVSQEQIEYCRSQKCDVIIIDHHEPGATPPPANVILHSISTSAAGLAWFFAREFLSLANDQRLKTNDEMLSLVAISVICDLVPLLGLNRSFAKYGLDELNKTQRSGLLALFEQAGLKPFNNETMKQLNSYHVGFIIGPRLNAAGRLEHALDSLRLLCTTDPARARELARHLNQINQLRQDKTKDSSDKAISGFSEAGLPKLIISASNDYDEGVIGLIASKLVETYHRPAIAVSIGEDISKGSARSLPGFHITDHLRHFSDLLSAVGGHSMAAGFSLPTPKLDKFIRLAQSLAEKEIPDEILVKNTRTDTEIPIDVIDTQLLLQLQNFEPFGLGNPRPVLKSTAVPVSNFRRLGDGRHLKFTAGGLEAIYFSAPPGVESTMTSADIIYSLDLNVFNGRETLQLIIKQLLKANS